MIGITLTLFLKTLLINIPNSSARAPRCILIQIVPCLWRLVRWRPKTLGHSPWSGSSSLTGRWRCERDVQVEQRGLQVVLLPLPMNGWIPWFPPTKIPCVNLSIFYMSPLLIIFNILHASCATLRTFKGHEFT